jgi:hypothetical protein
MGPGGKKPVHDGSVYHIFRELEDKDIWGYKDHHAKNGDYYIDDFKFSFTQLGGECVVHGVSMTQNETGFDNYSDFCNVYNVLAGSGIHFGEPTAEDCKYMPKDPRICGFQPAQHPHCEINVLFDHDCHTAYTTIDKDLHGMHPSGDHPSPDGKYYHVKRELQDKRIDGYTTKSIVDKEGHNTTWFDDLSF